MQRQTVIVLARGVDCLEQFDSHGTEQMEAVECFGSLKRACKAHPEFVYNTLTRNKFPFTYQGWTFHRVRFNELSHE